MKEEILIQTGELKSIKTGFASSTDIVYSGMPNETTFALTFTNVYWASNIYYPKESTFITIIKHRFKVIEVTSEYIILAYEKKPDIPQPNPQIRSQKDLDL